MHWLQCYTLFWRVFANIKSLIFIVWVNIITLCRLFWYYFCFKVINQFQKQPSRLVLKKGVLKIHRKFTVEHPCKFTAYFQNTFSQEHLWVTASAISCQWSLPISLIMYWLNPFVPNAPFFYSLKTSENPKVFWCFQGVEKGCIGNEWLNKM